MHELSVATNIVEIALEYAEKNNSQEIKEIEIEVGELSGIIVEALEFAMESATKNTLLENAKIVIRFMSGKAKCGICHHEFPVASIYEACPKCSSFNPDIIQGMELKVKSLVIN